MNISRQVIFVGGVPGSGKTLLCDRLRSLVPGLRHVGAGQLIRQALDGGADGYIRPPVADHRMADRFQELLVDAFSQIRAGHVGPLALDGHFVVPTASGPSPIASEVFRRLCVTWLVLVEAEAQVITRRLRQRLRPDWWDGRAKSIPALIALERRQASVVAGDLGLPLIPVGDGDEPQRLAEKLFGDR